ncbi:MAG TPA: hypothetical protein VIG47_05540 [Gemmatimonadaceae bacterium]|jgi:hypothetical protein
MSKLTEEQWNEVFAARCQSKQGKKLYHEQLALISLAYAEDPERYKAMEKDVFNATVPFGSDTKIK